MTPRGIARRLATIGALASLAGCNLLDRLEAPPNPPGGQTVSVSLDPPSATVEANGTVAFTATVTGTADTAVTWSVPGTGCGTVSPGGLYTAPGAAGTCQVVATSVADPTRSATAAITVTAGPPPVVSVAVTPASGSVNACQTLGFTATVTGATDRTVTWTVQEAGGGTIGASSGIYTAPSTPGTYHVVATSRADPTKSASAPVAVATRVLSVTVTPSVVELGPSGTAQLSATVTTTCGSYAATQTLHADGTITN
jgi:hypothetical protein